MITQARLKQLLHYNPRAGVFTWRVTRGGKARAGTRAGHVTKYGYRTICVGGRAVMAHVLAWLYVRGRLPKKEVDHKSRRRDDSRFSNLRAASSLQNCRNKSLYKNNKSGYPGVHWHKRDRVWLANIRVKKWLVHLGYFTQKNAAVDARKSAEVEYFGRYRAKGITREQTQPNRRRQQRTPRNKLPGIRSVSHKNA